MRSVFADSVGQFTKVAAPTVPKAKSTLATGFPGALKAETTHADRPAIAGSDYGMYANVVVNGKVVASLSNSGCAAIADAYGGPLMAQLVDMPGTGPKLSQKRAEIIALALGGTIEKLSTAQTPEQWAKGGKRVGMIDLWGIDEGTTGERPQPPHDNLTTLLRQQEDHGHTA